MAQQTRFHRYEGKEHGNNGEEHGIDKVMEDIHEGLQELLCRSESGHLLFRNQSTSLRSAPPPASLQPAYRQPAYRQPAYRQPTYRQPAPPSAIPHPVHPMVAEIRTLVDEQDRQLRVLNM